MRLEDVTVFDDFFLSLSCSGGGGAVGVRAVLRVQDPPVQGHTQPAGEVKSTVMLQEQKIVSK